MAMRAIASLTLAFGLVSIPVRLYAATERSAALHFKWLGRGGARLRQRYVVDAPPETADAQPQPADAPLEAADSPPAATPRFGRHTRADDAAPGGGGAGRGRRHASEPAPPPASPDAGVGHELGRDEMTKGFEYEKDRFVLFSEDELAALRTPSSDRVDIVGFLPQHAIEPIHYDKAYLLAPGPRAERSYTLLWRALQRSNRSALASWAWRGRERMVEIRAAAGGLVLQPLFQADEVRSFDALHIDAIDDVGEAEMRLALQLIGQHAREHFDPREFADAGKQRILDAVQRKIAGRQTVSHRPVERAPAVGGGVVDLLQALRDSLQSDGGSTARAARRPVARARTGAAAPRQTKGGKASR